MAGDAHQRAFHLYRALPTTLQRVIRMIYDEYVIPSSFGPSYERGFVERFFSSAEEYEEFVQEFQEMNVMELVKDARQEHRKLTGHGRFAAINRYTPSRLYALVRKLQPDIVVETGVCNGVSTWITLHALEQNGRGELRSVDYPDSERIPNGRDPGWIIPDDLRGRWELTMGLSQAELPGVIDDLDSIDLFLSDTKASILDEELDIVWPKLSDGAVIIADDVHKSGVFAEVTKRRPVDSGYLAPNVGYLVKRA